MFNDNADVTVIAALAAFANVQNFDYLELRDGVRCCGCEFIAANPNELTLHTMECHRQTVEAENDLAIVCEICCNAFESNQELRTHQKCVSGKDIFLCKCCMVCFNTKEKLMRHMSICAELNEDDRQDDNAFAEAVDLNRCDEVKSTEPLESVDASKSPLMLDEKFVTRREEYDEYQILHTDAKRCCCCGVFFASYDAVMAHVQEACPRSNRATEDATVCTVCGARFKSQKALKYHKGINDRINKIYYCKLCNLSFVRYFHLARHFHASLKHSTVGDGIVGKQDDRVMVALLKKLGSSVQPSRLEHVCCFLRCEASFDRRQDLLEHVELKHAARRRIHVRERTSQRHVCVICQLGFGSEQNLHRHLYQRYLKKTSICSFCGKGFKRPTLLRQHEQVEHTDTAPQFECAVCGKKFKKQSLLKLHLVTHEAERKFSCEHCSSQFHFRHQLKKHQQTVHATEFPYECSFCDRKMPNKNSYDLHLRTHTGEKPFVCRHGCCRAFSHSTDRRRHEMVAHTDEKPHRCAVCQTAYVRRRQLLQHFQRYPEHNTEAEDSSPTHDEVAED
ncbi:zinc finger protein 84-like [Anopheles cruzii]|uniref:zinc finger protein 84-like n=1 Tax=Anopheles cruzii TaxID=68878 RepID=UPI0022EC488B|nr:zinc finger protein 84-like [Anopheles cruzii]